MDNNQLNRIEFTGKNKFTIDKKFPVEMIKENEETVFVLKNRKFINESELFGFIDKKTVIVEGDEKDADKDDLLFDNAEKIDEMTTTGSVGGGMELPFQKMSKKTLNKRTAFPYEEVVTIVENLVKEALIEEYVKEHPVANMVDLYRKVNGENSEQNINNIENGIKIMYAEIFPSTQRRYFDDKNDYNGDGIPNQYKENNTALDLKYDGPVPEMFKERIQKEVGHDETGKQMLQAAAKKAQVKDENPANNMVAQLGNDIEFAPKEADKDKKNKMGFDVNLKEEKLISKFTFKNKDLSNRIALKESIPSHVKVNGTTFQMTDSKGNDFLIEWRENNAVILKHQNLLKEQLEQEKMNKFFTYNLSEKQQRKSPAIEFEMFTKKSVLKEESEQSLEGIVDRLNNQTINGHAVMDILNNLSEKVGGYGVDDARDHQSRPFWGDVCLKYINMGDSYAKTIVYDIDNETFHAISVADYIEQNNLQVK